MHQTCSASSYVQARHGGIPYNPYRRSHDTRWAPDIAAGALFPPSSQPSGQQHPSLHSQQLHSGASTQSALYTGDSATKALQSRRSTTKQDKLNSRSSKHRSSSTLQSGDSRTHPEPNSALHSGHSVVHHPMLHTSHQPTSVLHSGHSVTRPEHDPPQLRHHSAMQEQYAAGNTMYANSSFMHDSSQQRPATMEPSRQQPTSAIYTGDSNAHPLLSSSTPDRQELPYTGRHSSPSCDSTQEGAERRSAFGPVPTAPPSTVSRNGRIVERAAKVRSITLDAVLHCAILDVFMLNMLMHISCGSFWPGET